MPDTLPLSELITLIITTSPTPSAPSTELVEATLAAFRAHCPALLSRGCRVVVVLDTYDRVGASARLKKGQVTPEGAALAEAYRRNVRALVLREYGYGCGDGELELELELERGGLAEYGSPCVETNAVAYATRRTPDRRVTFIEPERRLGFGLAVREALRAAATPYVWVQQHDWPLVDRVPLRGIVGVMGASEEDEDGDRGDAPPVRYVCLPSVRMLAYAASAHVLRFPALRRLTAALKREFVVPSPAPTTTTTTTVTPEMAATAGVVSEGKEEEGASVIPLTPLFFWHDKPHVASRAHYLARVFPSRLAMPRGAFIEDTIGQRAREQMKEGNWAKWACWLYYPDDGRSVCLRHLNGRKWRGAEAEMHKKALWMEAQIIPGEGGGGEGGGGDGGGDGGGVEKED
ncbi:hypothetical protein F4809DRAFT_504871 [Biscogniauxia mediterranea]|nr:hypothetical protein F4809DRAFT_504871 [Biscogniauxia mediterranea]